MDFVHHAVDIYHWKFFGIVEHFLVGEGNSSQLTSFHIKRVSAYLGSGVNTTTFYHNHESGALSNTCRNMQMTCIET